MNSRAKGAAGERELAAWFRERGIEARRGQQFSGSPDSPDVIAALPGFHIECKRVERFNAYDAMAQAAQDCGNNVPVVFHRRNRGRWLVVMDAEHFLDCARAPK